MKIKNVLNIAHLLAMFGLLTMIFQRLFEGEPIMELARFTPAMGMIALISGQVDLLTAMQQGAIVNLRARILDFTHWLMLIGVNIGAYLAGATDLSWFTLKIILLAIIGWQVAVGYARKTVGAQPSEELFGIAGALAAACLGLASGVVRANHPEPFGYGWWFETITAAIATGIVFYWIRADLQTIKEKAHGYPRSTFLKGLFSNALVLWFWVHVIRDSDGTLTENLMVHFGLTFNILIGNVLYLYYYLQYEHYRAKP